MILQQGPHFQFLIHAGKNYIALLTVAQTDQPVCYQLQFL